MQAINLFFACICVAANAALLIALPPRLSIPQRQALLGGLLAVFCVLNVGSRQIAQILPSAAPPWRALHTRGSLAVFILLFINLFTTICFPALVRGLFKRHTAFNRNQVPNSPYSFL